MGPGRIRVLALCVIRRRDDLLVFEGHDPTKRQTFYRPLGGGIEFGELGHHAATRELREELGAELVSVRYLATLENIFTYDGRPGHEIVRLYEADLADAAFYAREDMVGQEDDGTAIRVLWKPLADFGDGQAPLYPEGLLELLLASARVV
jgi:8-oxo-dGTP pyrophosphatase MutT (NUDIX family)